MRIVSLLSSATEMLFALGLGDQVVAVSHECDFPREAQRLPKATRSLVDSSQSSGQINAQVRALSSAGAALYEIDAAQVCELRPDLIVTQAQCDVCAVRYQDVLELVESEPALCRTEVLALNPLSVEEILADIVRLGEATGVATAAGSYVDSLKARLDDVRETTAGLSGDERPRVVCLEWLGPLMAAGNWTPQLIWLAGGESGLASAGQHSGYVEPLDVLDYDPQVLILAPCGFDLQRTIEEAQPLLQSPFWGRISACRSGRVFALDGNAYLNRSGPRIIDTIEILAHLLHPRLLPTPACPVQQAWSPLELRDGRLAPLPALGPH